MHADREDLPDYLRPRERRRWHKAVVIGIGATIAISAMVLTAQPIVSHIAQLKNAVRVGGKPLFEQAPQTIAQQAEGPIYQQLESAQADPVTRRNQANPPREQSTPERQTTFNDFNYTAKGAANVVTFNEVAARKEPAPAKQASRVTIVEDSNAKKDYCWMHAKGSIEKRACTQQMDLYLRNK